MSVELETRLADLATALVVPPAPDVVPALIGRLPERRSQRRGPVRRRLALGFGVAFIAAGGTAMAVPPSRTAILRILGLRGVRIERVQRLPPLPAGAGARLGLGTRIPLARARHAAGFTALLAPGATAAYLAHPTAGDRLSVLVGPDLVIEFRATVAPFLVKIAPPGTHATFLRVNGGSGVYLYGAPHEVIFATSGGSLVEDRVRLAGDVLVWQQGPLTVRIEGTRTLAAALSLARSLR